MLYCFFFILMYQYAVSIYRKAQHTLSLTISLMRKNLDQIITGAALPLLGVTTVVTVAALVTSSGVTVTKLNHS